MTPFKTFRGVVATLDRANVDTDQIIPKQFLKSIKKTGFGESLFFDWRYLANGKPNPEFSLNQPQVRNAKILVARNNFGCGSSREHAVWSIQQYGFSAIIAPWQNRSGSRVPAFADIFRNNCGKNAVLTIELSAAEVDQIFNLAEKSKKLEATVNLEEQQVTFHMAQDPVFRFEIDAPVKTRLLKGLDDIGMTLGREKEIQSFEKKHDPQLKR